jgi:hypothetical protein
VVCLWIKQVAVGLKRIKITDQTLTKQALLLIRSAIANSKSKFVEIDILNNKFPSDLQLENTKKFSLEIVQRNAGFNIWQHMRAFQFTQDRITISEGDLTPYNPHIFQLHKVRLSFADSFNRTRRKTRRSM